MNNYTSNFNVGFLDDLHNYFPDLLYNSDRFTTVQEVLQYIQARARNQFNLFDRGRNAYQAHIQQIQPIQPTQQIQTNQQIQPNQQNQPIPITQPQIQQNPIQIQVQETNAAVDTSGASVDTITPVRPRVRVTTTNPPRIYRRFPSTYGHYTSIFDDISNDENLMSMSPLGNLSSLLNIALNPSFGTMNDVIVVPTPEQINNATTLTHSQATSVIEDCAICQEPMDTNLRKINSCSHLFHRSCIETWFQSGVTCPICRIDIRE